MNDNKPRNTALVFGGLFVRVVCEALFLVAAAVVCLECTAIRAIKKLSPKQLVLFVAVFLCTLLLIFPPKREAIKPIQTRESGKPKEIDVAGALERIEHKLDNALLDSSHYNATTEVVHTNHHHHHHHHHYHTNITNNVTTTIDDNKNEKEKEKDLFERDRHDYALITNGARIEDSSRTYCIGTSGKGGGRGHSPLCKNTPAHILAPDGAAAVRPGECWGLAGSSGFVVIRLREAVVPRAVAVVHPTRGDISGAPREFRVYGVDIPDDNKYDNKCEGTYLGSFVYDARSPDVAQEFALREQGAAFRYVRVEVVSNWGNSAWTCLYKVKLFGNTI